IVMMPGAIYLGLTAGQTLGSAAEWVTIILFAELAKRSFSKLKRQEVYVLFYVASSVAAVTLAQVALAGGPFAGIIWNQYLLQSPQTSTIAGDIPDWVVPPATSAAIQDRNLLHHDWWWSASHGALSPILLIVIGYILGRLAWFGLGYVMFRITSDLEKLPFPMAPVAAQGATALAESTIRTGEESQNEEKPWRWKVFSAGASFGIVFASLYVLLPVVTGLFLAKPIMLFPIPFVDFTRNIEGILPASLVSFSFDAGLFLAGMILPFRLILGTFAAIIVTSILGNPILQHFGFFKHWTPGNGLLVNQMILNFDFWLSVSIGMAGAVALVGVYFLIKTFRKERQTLRDQTAGSSPKPVVNISPQDCRKPSRDRGDFPMWAGVALFAVSTFGFAWISHVLVPGFPFWIILLFGFIWTPLNSYISARLIGLTGQGVGVPFLKETAFITSGYKGIDIWFAPIPLGDHGGVAQRFRELELTRTKFTSIIKAEIMMMPVIFVSSFLFWAFFWHLNQIPSDSFPYAAQIWPVAARQSFLILTANNSAQPLLLEALKPDVIAASAGVGLALYCGLSWLGLPIIFFYGIIGGIGAPLHAGLPMLIGALVGRYYFTRKFGSEKWNRYVPVVAAGFSCGMGLAGMTAVAFSLVAQCTKNLPY
ncbi:MAG: peptide transporter, partial [bacterium]